MDESEEVPRFIHGQKTETSRLIESGEAGALQIEFHVDQSGLNRSSRDQPETRYYCPEAGCKSSFKRKYDIDRHYQAKHVQSKNFFCPVKGCKCSVEPDLVWGGFWRPYPWGYIRQPLKWKEIARDEGSGHRRYVLYGFHRKDRLLKHVARYHKELAPELASLLKEKDTCLEDPLLGETQDFQIDSTISWNATLARIQRKDGNWTDWSGARRNEVAALGFKRWTDPELPKAGNVSNISYENQQASPGCACTSAQDSASNSAGNAGNEMAQFSQGQNMVPAIGQLGDGTFLPLSTNQLISNDYNQDTLWPAHQLSLTDHFPDYGHVNTWMPDTSEAMLNLGNVVNCFERLPDLNNFSTELVAPVQISQPYGNAIGSSTNMFDFNSISFEGISGEIYMPVDGGYTPAETDQTISEDSNVSSGEYFDSVANYSFDAAPWNPTNGTQGW